MANYIIFEGFRMDARTRDMLVELRRICEAPVRITQGGFNKGGVTASAGTHDGGGALDIRAKDLTTAERKEVVRRARQVGFAAWLRTPAQANWPYHVHMIAVGCDSLSAGAEKQVVAYHNGKNGLKNNRADDGDRLYADNTWESYQAQLAALKPPKDAPPAKVATGPRVSLKLIAYAANGGYFRSGQIIARNEATRVAHWLLDDQKIVTARDVRVWEAFVRQGNWRSAGLQYTGMVEKFQAHYGLAVDGDVGPITKAKFSQLLTQDNYRVVA
ncbi:hypothetical protein [Kribbella sindirgiensis]|uniref:Peptidoglycan-binding protein n=1 Tax=Kribbella sindirgiensis TaxID=1124744 RepID=A0A4V2M1X7_9ACTN|nr:hypothetical protein [Kribbella sindirgiensis]TCC19969.1 hypothetical protein E0H50_37730 [Kribbella sindirgiensis]